MTDEEFQDLCDEAEEIFLTPKKGPDQVILVVAAVARFLYGQHLQRLERQPDAQLQVVVKGFELALEKGIKIYAKIKEA